MRNTAPLNRNRRSMALRTVLGALAAVSLLAMPIGASAQTKPQAPKTGAGVKKTTFDRWHLLCQAGSCAVATNAVRGVVLFGYNKTDAKLVMQIRLPAGAPEGRPVALRLHKSGSILQLRVSACQKSFCTAAAAANKTQQVVKIFAKESSGTLAYQLGQTMQIEVFSLAGFNKAYSELLKRKPKPRAKKK